MNVAVTTEHFHDMKHNNGNSKSRPVESKCCLDSGFPCLYVTFKKYKLVTIGKTRNCVKTLRPAGVVFPHNFSFFQFPLVLI